MSAPLQVGEHGLGHRGLLIGADGEFHGVNSWSIGIAGGLQLGLYLSEGGGPEVTQLLARAILIGRD
jgi:hypothetical protein